MARRLASLGVAAESAGHAVGAMVQTSLRGVDSHGINLFPHYCRAVTAGRINARPALSLERTSPSTAVLHADHAFGHHSGAVAMDAAIALAADAGTGCVAVRDSTHFGAAAYFGLRAPASGCLGFAFTNADSLVKAHNAKVAFFGTNPICFTAPLEREEPLCLDMATSRVAWNKVRERRQSGAALVPGWAFDQDGRPTEDAAQARTLAPIGAYKGFGLGMMVEVLCALLAGGPAATELLPMYTSPIAARRRISHFFVALDISRFAPVAQFKARLQAVVDSVRRLPGEAGQPVMVPGDPEKQCFERRSVEGIPVSPEVLAQLHELDPDFDRAVMP
jgi:LDH2 family malate/lactate/ureidoglycolate dehydrogenase